MPVPSPRNKILPARGDYADLLANIQELGDGEVCYALDQDKLYVREGASLVDVSGSGDYNDLINKPNIPDSTSDLTNDSGFITAADVPPAYDDTALANRVTTNEADISQLQTDIGNSNDFSGDYNDLTNKPSIPSATSDLTNDSGFITASDVPGGFSGDYEDLTNKPSIPSTPGDIGAATAAQGALADSAIQPGEVNPVYFANQAAFPDAAANHGAVAHSHADGAMYFAHGGVWNKLANFTEIPPANNISLVSLDPLP